MSSTAYTFYDATVPVLQDALESLGSVLKKGSESPNAASLPQARLTADMLPLSFQVYFATDLAQKLVARASGTEPLVLEDNLETFDDFFKRIETVQGVLAKADKQAINQSVDQVITFGMGPAKEAKAAVRHYASGWVLPNLFFHVVTAYNILRKEGIELGKRDYLTPFLVKHLVA